MINELKTTDMKSTLNTIFAALATLCAIGLMFSVNWAPNRGQAALIGFCLVAALLHVYCLIENKKSNA